jgi:CPA2 family monovalent cation:H+ antiporter-2
MIARASTQAGVQRLAELGAQEVIHPELEGGLAIVSQVLAQLGFPEHEVEQYAEAVRRDRYQPEVNTISEQEALERLMNAAPASQEEKSESTELR